MTIAWWMWRVSLFWMLFEESPDQIGGWDVVVADAQAWPHVVAALDRIEGDSGAGAAAGINVGVNFGGLFVFWRGRQPSNFTQNATVSKTGVSERIRAHLIGRAAAVERDEVVAVP